MISKKEYMEDGNTFMEINKKLIDEKNDN